MDTTQSLALVGSKIYVSPTAAPIPDGVVLIRDGKILAVGSRSEVAVPENSVILEGTGLVLTAGYWNSHVHLMEPKWQQADSLPADHLSRQLQEMLTSYGFTYAVDAASLDTENLLAIRNRIDKDEVAGPKILLVGQPFTPPAGSPFYIAPLKLPEIGSPDSAAAYVQEQIAGQADGIKIWSASPNGKQIVYMPVAVAKAAVAAAHALGKPVMAHPTDNRGVEIAAESGVDILTHVSPEDREVWSSDLIQKMLAANMALIPTLKLYKWELEQQGIAPADNTLLKTAIGQVQTYAGAGGDILFGTDVGYMSDYSPVDEYELMAASGMTFRQILAALTTAPAARFGLGKKTGTIAVGMDADLVLLKRDPADDPKAFSDVKYTIRNGKIVFQAE